MKRTFRVVTVDNGGYELCKRSRGGGRTPRRFATREAAEREIERLGKIEGKDE